MKTLTIILSLVVAVLLVGCSRAEPTPDTSSVEATVAQRIFATLTASAPTATPVPTNTAEPRATNTLAPTATNVPPTATPTITEPSDTPIPLEPTSTPEPTPTLAGAAAVVKSQSINVRAGPGTGHPIMDSANLGDTLEVVARTNDGSWVNVVLPNGDRGWVSASLVDQNTAAGDIEVAEVIPTSPPPLATPTTVPQAVASSRDLEVSFLNPHYNCEQSTLYYRDENDESHPLWGYRWFQVDLYIKNNGTAPVVPPWKPRRWIITDGANDFVNDIMWQWGNRDGLFDQPTIQPGQIAGWTFGAFPIDRNQWVRAVEFEKDGNIYRSEFDLGPYGNSYNFQDCGEPKNHGFFPTPTPEP